jgi:predicted RND superfamily exporter protein
VGVDYAVHYSSVALELKDAEKAFDYASRPIITNALGLAIGMSALFTTPLMIHTQVSIMMWVTMVLSMFLSLSLLPTMMRWYLKRRSK